jgi:hypothetical protein
MMYPKEDPIGEVQAGRRVMTAIFQVLGFSLFNLLQLQIPAQAQGGFDGKYINQFGSEMEITGSLIHYTGVWNGEKVSRKPIGFNPGPDGRFQMGGQDCSFKRNLISCLRKRDNVVVTYVPEAGSTPSPSIKAREAASPSQPKAASSVPAPVVAPSPQRATVVAQSPSPSPVDISDPLAPFDGSWVALNPPGPLVNFFKGGLGQRMASLAMGQASIRVSDGTSGSQLRVSGEGFNCYYAISFVGADEMVWQLKQGESVCFANAHYKKSR